MRKARNLGPAFGREKWAEARHPARSLERSRTQLARGTRDLALASHILLWAAFRLGTGQGTDPLCASGAPLKPQPPASYMLGLVSISDTRRQFLVARIGRTGFCICLTIPPTWGLDIVKTSHLPKSFHSGLPNYNLQNPDIFPRRGSGSPSQCAHP